MTKKKVTKVEDKTGKGYYHLSEYGKTHGIFYHDGQPGTTLPAEGNPFGPFDHYWQAKKDAKSVQINF